MARVLSASFWSLIGDAADHGGSNFFRTPLGEACLQMSESKDHQQNQIASGAFGFDVRMDGSRQLGGERQIRSTSVANPPVEAIASAVMVRYSRLLIGSHCGPVLCLL